MSTALAQSLFVPTVLRNGRIYTPAGADVTALVVQDGLIVWLGTEEGVAAHLDSATEVVDLEDALVTPAFVDAHVHTTATGLALTGLDLHALSSRGELLDRVAAFARTTSSAVILGDGWDDTAWPDPGVPTSAELDRAADGRPVYLSRVDGHSAVVSSALLVELGRSGEPGPLSGPVHDQVRALAYKGLRRRDRQAAQTAALEAAARAGIGCVHEMAGPVVSSAEDLTDLLALAGAPGSPGVDVIGYWGELHGVETAAALGAAGAGGDIFCDGSIGSHTAALHAPYADLDGPPPPPRLSEHEIAEHLMACTRAGMQGGFHAIGDAAVEAVLGGLERAAGELGPRVRSAGHRIEHLELHGDPARFARSGLIGSVQPAFDATWGGPDGLYARRLGTARAAGMNDFNALVSAGAALAFGSDSPVTPFDPWGAVRAAAYHRTPGASISVRAAFAAHTRGGWRAARRDGDGSGVLAVGSPATFAVWAAAELFIDVPDERVSRWSTDPRAAVAGLPDLAPDQPRPACRRTVVRGRTIFDGTP